MTSLTRFAVGRPRQMLAMWLAAVVALAIVGLSLKDHLQPTRLVLPNTSSAAWDDLRDGRFGDDTVILLRGPRRELDRQGPAIAAALAKRTDAPQVSPWSGAPGIENRLRPEPGLALLIADLTGGEHLVPAKQLETVQDFVDTAVKPPLTATLTGPAPLAQALNDEALNAATEAEHLAVPLLLLVLLLVFRSPLAAAIPLLVAAGTVLAGRGALRLLTEVIGIDAISDVLLSMIGLALGVDYALLIVTRYREALGEGDDRRHAATLAAHTAGRTAMFAGVTLLTILVVTLLLAPGKVLVSAAAGGIVGTVLSVIGALAATPAMLVLLGPRIGPLPPDRGGGLLGRVVGAAVARPKRAAALAVAPLLVAALGLTALRTVPPDPRGLPGDSPGGRAFAAIDRAGFGPGVEVMIHRRNGPVSETRTIQAVRRLERRLSRVQGVRSVAGPGPLGAAFEAGTQRQITRARDGLKRARRGLARLRDGLGDAGLGSQQLADGGGQAGNGATLLAGGAGRARTGAGQLADGTGQAAAGARRLTDALDVAGAGTTRLGDGAAALKAGGERTSAGAQQLADALGARLVPGLSRLSEGLRGGADGLGQLREPAQLAQQKAQAALEDLQKMSLGLVDPRYRSAVQNTATALAALTGRDPRNGSPVRAGYDGLDAALATAAAQARLGADGAQRLADGGRRAARGAARLHDGTAAVATGVGRLESGIDQLTPGLGELSDGASQAVTGLDALAAGGGRLEGGLSELEGRLAELAGGLRRLEGGQRQLTDGLQTALRKLSGEDPLAGQSAKAPALLRSGYATLAALDTASPLRRAAGRYIVDLDRGGGTARILLLTDLEPNDPRSAGLVAEVQGLTDAFARKAKVEAAVGGLATQLVQFDEATRARLPLIIVGIALATFIVLVGVLRSLLLPAIAVGLNLLTVAATFGIMTKVFVGEDPLLGGTGAIDVLAACSAFAIIFALSIDYQVFLLARMREGYVLTQDATQAISFGIRHTARIVTGAALIMFGTFAAFGTTGVASVQQFGVGLAVAIALDATIVRLVLLPAVMRLAGERVWWLPDRFERKLPELDVEGVGYVRIREEMSTRAAELW